MLAPEFLTVEDVLLAHAEQLRLFGGLDSVRDLGALESAVAMAQATYDGLFLHDDLFVMAAAYAFHIAENQPFLDGNKRTGLNAALLFLELNGWTVDDPTSELYAAMIGISAKTVSKAAFAEVLRKLSTPSED